VSPAQLLAADRYAGLLGIRMAPGDEVAVAMEVTEDMTNFLGVAHGGVIFSLADCAFSLISNAPGPRALAVDTHLALVAGAKAGDILTATAETVQRGRTMGTYRVLVTRGDGRVVAAFTGTVSVEQVPSGG